MDKPQSRPLARLDNLLTFGNIWLYVLSLTKDSGKTYAYGLPQAIEKGYGFRPNRVMVYVVLYKLESEGMIRSEFEERRKYYHITSKGTDTLARAKTRLAQLSKRL